MFLNTEQHVLFPFQGLWKNKFPKDSVVVSDFFVDDSRSCEVNMMNQETRFNYKDLREEKVQLLEMPYRGDDITMVIILPNKGHPLSQVDSLTKRELSGSFG